jgi:serine protease Do
MYGRTLFAGVYGAVLWILSTTGAGAFDNNWGNVKGWEIGWPNHSEGCSAWGEFDGGTAVKITLEKNAAYLTFFNDRWNFIREDKKYYLRLVFDGRSSWKGKFIGINLRNELFGLTTDDVNIDFLKDLASYRGIRFYIMGSQKPLDALSLYGSMAAILKTIECLKSRQNPQLPTRGKKPGGEDSDQVAESGSGIIVSDQGHILTNHHVVKNCSSIHVTQLGDIPRAANILRSDPTNDLVIIKIKNEELTGNPAKFKTDSVKQGENIAVYGFPLAGALSLTGNVVSGNITSLSVLMDDTRFFQISAPVQPGNSGGPLIDSSGLIVGVVTSRISDVAVAKATGASPQNVNFAIKGTVAMNFLEVHSVPYQKASEAIAQPLTKLVDDAKLYTVLVACP